MTDKQKELLNEYLKLQDEVEEDKRPLQEWCNFVNIQSHDDLGVILHEALKVHRSEGVEKNNKKQYFKIAQ